MRGRFRVSKDGVSGRGRRRDLSWLTVLIAGEDGLSAARELEVRGVTKSYAGCEQPTLAGVDLVLRRGGSAAVSGRPESGLTTFAAIVAGALAAKGDVLVDGRPRRSGEVAFVPAGADEELEGCADLSVRTFLVRRYAAAGGLPRRLAERCALGALRDFDLGAVEATPVGRLCHLERLRLLVARALTTAPPFLVIDEPERGLSGGGAITAVNYLLDMASAISCGVLYTTKSAGQAAAAEQWFELRGGRLHDMGRDPARLRVVG